MHIIKYIRFLFKRQTHNLQNWYENLVENKSLLFNQTQANIVKQLDGFVYELNCNVKPKNSGYYIFGSVGSGKTMILNAFFNSIERTTKLRQHFHEFMLNINHQLQLLQSALEIEPIDIIVEELKNNYDVIFLDEFHINDMATAMIMHNFFNALFKNQIHLVVSSNYSPFELCNDSLMRERFLSAAKTISNNLDVIQLSTDDYRYSKYQSSIKKYFIKSSKESYTKLQSIFNEFKTQDREKQLESIQLNGYKLSYIECSGKTLWVCFTSICGVNRHFSDYIELCKRFDCFIVSNMTNLDNKNTCQRFCWLIDVLYDQHSLIVLESSFSMSELSNKITKRTASRLYEMQTEIYIYDCKKYSV